MLIRLGIERSYVVALLHYLKTFSLFQMIRAK